MDETPTNISQKLIRAVKAELARRGMGSRDLQKPMRLSRAAVDKRLRLETPLDTDELTRIAEFLDIPMSRLWDAAIEPEERNRVHA